ncbi:TetR/AcrR family transcriptional regulator [Niabella drilacis]|uniref:TetR/AcrR family transcriptional regulator n=1 Tax=Niabella drilacis (strain DSM 25811 / CCM 8410 / CCUG 62505 / LMG 26954 / E90) TaxID=1285928 RepID=UPI000B824B4F|nr:TetR/AcrR family transcriptional regulator [Niabella drilacis]
MPKTVTNKEPLLKNSLKVFLKNRGYHTTLSGLAKASAPFYYSFKNKEDLMKAILIYARQHIIFPE